MAKNEDEPKAPSGWDKIMGGARTGDEWARAAVEDRAGQPGRLEGELTPERQATPAIEDRPKVVARDLGADIERKVEEIGEKLRDARREPGLEQQIAALKDRQRGRDGRGDEGRGR
jgi:hypothetical protein